jgi:DNA-binding NarL/FixJ family response regulator
MIQPKLIDQTILELIAEGFAVKDIAVKVFLSPKSVEHRIDKMREKEGAKNVAHLVAKFYESKLSKLPPGEYTVLIRDGETKK